MLYTLREIFQNKIFRIPAYQRGYSWDKKQLEQLWDDIKNINYPNPQNSFHFTGILTLNKFDESSLQRLSLENHTYNINEGMVSINNTDYEPYHLVDGQQRLTSLLILLSILIDEIIENENYDEEFRERVQFSKSSYIIINNENGNTQHLFGYETDVPSHQFLLNQVFNDETIECTEPYTLYTNKLTDAKTFFLEKINACDDDEIRKIFCKIEERLLFSTLLLNGANERTIDVSMAFETLNFRGKELSNLELFKNRLLYLVSKTTYPENDKIAIRNEIINTWLIIYKWLGRNKDKSLNDDEFLKAFWLLQFSSPHMVSEDFKRWIENLFNELFSLEITPNDNPYLQRNGKGSIFNWLQNMQKAIELWFIIKNPYFEDEEFNYVLNENIKTYLQKINTFPNSIGTYIQNLFLSVLFRHLRTYEDWEDTELNEDNLNNYEVLENLLKLIERHNFSCFILNGNTTSFNREKIFRCVHQYFINGNGAQLINGEVTLINHLDHYLQFDLINGIRLEDINRFIHRENHYYDWIGIEYFLIHWEIYLANQNQQVLTYQELKSRNLYVHKIIDANSFVFHHMQQQTRERNIFSLGNLFLSRTGVNHQNFYQLSDRINNSQNRTFNEIELLNYQEWNTTNINDRGREMFTFLINNWNLQGNLGNPENFAEARWREILLDN